MFQSGPRKRRGFEWDRVDLEVAQAAETSHPETSLPIYLGEAERLIATRGRENYQAACEYLQKVKRLFTAVGRKDDWLTRIATIRAQNRSLRALHEEMTRAGL